MFDKEKSKYPKNELEQSQSCLFTYVDLNTIYYTLSPLIKLPTPQYSIKISLDQYRVQSRFMLTPIEPSLADFGPTQTQLTFCDLSYK